MTFFQRHRVNPLDSISRSGISDQYSRESFVLLLRFIRDRLQIPREEWVAVLDRFFDIYASDNSMKMDTVRYQDFCGLLFLHGVYTMDVYRLITGGCCESLSASVLKIERERRKAHKSKPHTSAANYEQWK
ncbi:hypothetical protein B0H14DRAFT_2590893 [Mycena olivaceomarginata]|nr:hypothetical protein B0H14DRAFT_2590893 [Mycena olivaceomarginata]